MCFFIIEYFLTSDYHIDLLLSTWLEYYFGWGFLFSKQIQVRLHLIFWNLISIVGCLSHHRAILKFVTDVSSCKIHWSESKKKGWTIRTSLCLGIQIWVNLSWHDVLNLKNTSAFILKRSAMPWKSHQPICLLKRPKTVWNSILVCGLTRFICVEAEATPLLIYTCWIMCFRTNKIGR